MKIALLALLLTAFGVLLWPWRGLVLHTEPPAPKRLLVAVDTVSGTARGLDLLNDEKMCGVMATAPAWPALFQLKATERLECRAPK